MYHHWVHGAGPVIEYPYKAGGLLRADSLYIYDERAIRRVPLRTRSIDVERTLVFERDCVLGCGSAPEELLDIRVWGGEIEVERVAVCGGCPRQGGCREDESACFDVERGARDGLAGLRGRISAACRYERARQGSR